MFKKEWVSTLVKALFVFLFPVSASAFKVSPIELNFSTKGKGLVQTIAVENDSESKIPVEISAFDRTHVSGKEIRVKTRDFYFFPKQFIMKPGEKRNIRISWMGIRSKEEPKDKRKKMQKGNVRIAQEKAYRLEVSQVPVDLKKKNEKKSGIKFLYNYVASLYVTPKNAKPDIRVESYKVLSDREIEFSIRNFGGAHAIFAFYNLYLKGDKNPVLEMTKQRDEIQAVNLLSGEKRLIRLKVPNSLTKGRKSFEFKKR